MMRNDNQNSNQITNWVRRIARILSIPIILFALLTVIGYTWSWITTGVADPYAVENTPPWEVLSPILMLLGIVGLGIAWWWEGLGGAINLLFQASVFVVLLITRPITQDFSRAAIPYTLSVVIAIPGILFLVYWWRSSRTPARLNAA